MTEFVCHYQILPIRRAMSSVFDDEIIENSDDDHEDVLPSDVLHQLQNAWIDERMCPELLPYEGDVVDCMLDQVEQMEANLKRVNKTDFKVSIHKLEVERIRYILTSYLRCRVTKIEHFNRYLLDDEVMRGRMSPGELKFATDYRHSLERHMAEVVLSRIPATVSSSATGSSKSQFDDRLAASESTIVPNKDAHVFLRVEDDCPGVLINDDTGESRSEELDLAKGSLYLIRYDPVSDLLLKKQVHLI